MSLELTGSRLYFPSLLTRLQLAIEPRYSPRDPSLPTEPQGDEVNAALVDVCALTHLIRFSLNLAKAQPDMDLSVLQRLKSVRSFAPHHSPWETRLSDQQVEAMRAWTQLERFEFSRMDPPQMRALLRRPPCVAVEADPDVPARLHSRVRGVPRVAAFAHHVGSRPRLLRQCRFPRGFARDAIHQTAIQPAHEAGASAGWPVVVFCSPRHSADDVSDGQAARAHRVGLGGPPPHQLVVLSVRVPDIDMPDVADSTLRSGMPGASGRFALSASLPLSEVFEAQSRVQRAL